jgi:hypothetical protein
MGRAFSTHGSEGKLYEVLAVKKSRLGRPRHRREDNIKIYILKNRMGGCGTD